MAGDRFLRRTAGRAWVLVAAGAIASCENPVDPSKDVTVFKNLSVTLTRPDVAFTVPPTSSNAGALTTRFTVEVNPAKFRPGAIETTWSLAVDPPDAGSVSPAQGRSSALPRSNRLADPFYDGSFESTFTLTPGFPTERVTVVATVQVVEQNPTLDVLARDSLVIPVERLVAGVPPERLDCQASPATGPAPLTVAFDASGRNCGGRCQFRWDFGDGESATSGRATHVYQRAGAFTARGTLTDSGRGTSTCDVGIVALSAAPTPTPGANQPPVIGAITMAPGPILTIRVTAPISDPDGDVPTWTLAVVATPPGATATPAPAAGTGSPVLSLLTLSADVEGTYRIRITADDGRGGTDVEEGSFLYDRPI